MPQASAVFRIQWRCHIFRRATETGANTVLSIDLDYETVGQDASMLMVTASGTAVVVA